MFGGGSSGAKLGAALFPFHFLLNVIAQAY